MPSVLQVTLTMHACIASWRHGAAWCECMCIGGGGRQGHHTTMQLLQLRQTGVLG